MDEITPLERIRRQLALSVAENAVFDGWTQTAVDAAADAHGISREQARLAMPKDAVGLIDLYGQAIDRELTTAFPPERVAALKIRARIRELLWGRIQLQAPAKEAIRRALATLAMPQNLAAAARLSWTRGPWYAQVSGALLTPASLAIIVAVPLFALLHRRLVLSRNLQMIV